MLFTIKVDFVMRSYVFDLIMTGIILNFHFLSFQLLLISLFNFLVTLFGAKRKMFDEKIYWSMHALNI